MQSTYRLVPGAEPGSFVYLKLLTDSNIKDRVLRLSRTARGQPPGFDTHNGGLQGRSREQGIHSGRERAQAPTDCMMPPVAQQLLFASALPGNPALPSRGPHGGRSAQRHGGGPCLPIMEVSPAGMLRPPPSLSYQNSKPQFGVACSSSCLIHIRLTPDPGEGTVLEGCQHRPPVEERTHTPPCLERGISATLGLGDSWSPAGNAAEAASPPPHHRHGVGL